MSIWVCSSVLLCSKQLSLECLISAFPLQVPSLSLLPPQSNTGSCCVLWVFCLSLDLCSHARNFPLVFQSLFHWLVKGSSIFSSENPTLLHSPSLGYICFIPPFWGGLCQLCRSFHSAFQVHHRYLDHLCATSLSVLSIHAVLRGAACRGHFISLTSQKGLLRCWAANLWGVWESELQLENNFCLLYHLFSSFTSLSVGLHSSAILHIS